MRRVINGAGVDNTAAAQAYLATNPTLLTRDLALIGEPENPQSIWMTDHEAPVLYQPYGVFNPASFSRGQVSAKIGLDVQSMAIEWAPSNQTAALTVGGASPAQLARLHFYDNWPVLVLRAYMPTPGDANTIGCAIWFGGRVDTAESERNKITFNVQSYTNVLSQKVPSTVIEVTNTLAGTTAATPPSGSQLPTFTTVTGSTQTNVLADCLSPSAGNIYAGDVFSGGYMVFLPGAGATLAGVWSAIGQNGRYTDGHGNSHSLFEIYAALPWPPTPGVDNFYVSTAPPINLGDEGYYGFPYVPQPQTAV